jgi:hypothetical protein
MLGTNAFFVDGIFRDNSNMSGQLHFVRVGVLACFLMPSTEGFASTATPRLACSATVAAVQAAPVPGKACLDCHGPVDKFMAASTRYQVPGGEKINPHRYVPHDSKSAAEIPDCTNCHSAHSLSPLPKTGTVDRSKLNVEWCFKACHHTKDFTPCKKCHE